MMSKQPNYYVLGDVQGCDGSLQALLAQLFNEPKNISHLIFAGDLINRGPQSLQTLRTVMQMGERAQAVLGNHDLHLLAVACGIRPAHRDDTLDDILNAPDREELIHWLRHRPLAIHEQGHLIVHAGVLPQWDLHQALALAAEVEAMLQSEQWVDFLRHMYGNHPARWSDDLSGYERLRCIINAFTRLRFCQADGTMDFAVKEGAAAAPEGLLPWFEVPGRRTAEVTVVFGHWSTLGLVMRPNLIALDTGCVWGGKLSAVRLEDRALFQVQCPQARQPG
ncbi:symmetrical bis(5'-nucleosyl)-tetraphosphatase [Herbaspirillum rubrisubalbicans]|uniref:Bis(5'-nucleosyl)-tetraphosphatase, symmetrical n=1 Tax=Herbaspirillum rubrisubalbicans Os34 TaxID=1235827 RepID=A0A6M3ZLB0_9BURK|nr:symmetrical bis(5'-nucleosyl)-tetraphosphatase [Herbaspirillum rubrisubalbicans]QJP99142.1 symmetrical bis(5'-nucleosyl)-tetraphosphatase [Herbaspirillum rubrisubalbicans Os34]